MRRPLCWIVRDDGSEVLGWFNGHGVPPEPLPPDLAAELLLKIELAEMWPVS